MFRLKMKKSAGIPVTGAVHRLIVRANKARDRRDWPQAAEAYAKAVQADPILAHIWIQLGHALREHRQRAAADDAYRRAVNLRPDDPDLAPIWIQVAHSFKEQGQFAEAADAYRRAASLRPDDPDPHLYLGHLASRAGEHTAAGRHYLASFQADPGHADVAKALHGAIKLARGHIRQQFLGAIRSTLSNSPSPPIALKPDIVASSSGELSLTFDASDLILYFAHNRVPTGIQRVQIHAITGALRTTTASAAKAREVHVCCIIKGRDGWLEIPGASFLALVDLSQRSSDQTEPAWIIALDRLHLDLALAPEFVFPHGSCLVNLGASWQLHNYFLYVRAAKAKYAIRYIPFIHDLIPILAPQHFARGARLEVVPWLIGVLTHSDHFLANSQSTRRDLIAAAAIIGHTLDPANVAVIPLDADSRTPTQDLPTTALERWDVEEGQFALLVSTVESRKGHITAFEAWRALITRHGVAKLPKLLCVGKRGWLCDEVYERLEQDPALAAHVIMLSGLTDDEVALLYRTCLFTVYPSLYEGWGLPITEALCWSKPVIASDTSSLPEAGTSFAVYVEPGSISALAAAVERMTFDAAWRDGITARIKDGFKPRNWTDIALQIETELTRFAAGRMTSKPIPVSNATLGAYHPLGRGTARRIWPGASNGGSLPRRHGLARTGFRCFLDAASGRRTRHRPSLGPSEPTAARRPAPDRFAEARYGLAASGPIRSVVVRHLSGRCSTMGHLHPHACPGSLADPAPPDPGGAGRP